MRCRTKIFKFFLSPIAFCLWGKVVSRYILIGSSAGFRRRKRNVFFTLIIIIFAFGALFIKDSMETNARLAEAWEVLEERKEAREALNAAQ